jgi:methyltransferase (TIGR00027 family)
VILGAGLDGRAFRMPELSEVDVFELDHPDTQGPKRERSATLARTCRSLRFVAIDFERDSLERALEDAGHRKDVPTVWLWEGVVMYLRDEAVRSTLSVVSARSAPGSTIAVQYNTREGHSLANALMLRIWGEPQIGLRTPEKMASELEAAGFRVVADACAAEWASSHGAPPPGRSSAKRLRIALARK